MNQKRNVVYYLILSIAGAALLISLAWLSTPLTGDVQFLDKLLVGVVFISSCLFGISLAVRPNWTRRLIQRRSRGLVTEGIHTSTRKNKGHHPDCKGFRGHVIEKRDRTLCAGCSGLASGSVISILLMVMFIILPYRLSPTAGFVLVTIGLVLVAANYVETAILTRQPRVHQASNVILVIGFFLVVIGMFHLTGNAVYGIFGVVMSFLWLDTRIQISSWRNAEICRSCSEICKAY